MPFKIQHLHQHCDYFIFPFRIKEAQVADAEKVVSEWRSKQNVFLDKGSEPGEFDLQKRLKRLNPEAEQSGVSRSDAFELFKTGVKHSEGRGVPQNHAEAAKWFRLAADSGYAPAQANLGYAYYEGKGVPLNYEEAAKRFRLAAEQGIDFAQYMLAKCYLAGRGVEKSSVEAAKWLNLASRQGYIRAHYLLGLLLSMGENNEPVNAPAAYALLTLAENSGNKDATEAKVNLVKKMTQQQREEGEQLSIEYAGKFMKKNPDTTPLKQPCENIMAGEANSELAAITHAIALDKDNCNLYFQRSIIKEKLGDREGQIEDLEEAIRLSKLPTHLNKTYFKGAIKMGWPRGHTAMYEMWLLSAAIDKRTDSIIEQHKGFVD
jgi:TPR repeat protein